MDFEKTFHQLCNDVFDFDIDSYLQTNSKVLLGVSMNSTKKRFEELFGDFPSTLLPIINTRYSDAEAGYRTDLQKTFSSITVDCDLFLLNNDRLNDTDLEIISLMIHEICHLIIDSNNLANTSLVINDGAKYLGNKIYSKTTTPELHSIDFCNILAAACINAENRLQPKKKRIRYANLAMKFDLSKKLE